LAVVDVTRTIGLAKQESWINDEKDAEEEQIVWETLPLPQGTMPWTERCQEVFDQYNKLLVENNQSPIPDEYKRQMYRLIIRRDPWLQLPRDDGNRGQSTAVVSAQIAESKETELPGPNQKLTRHSYPRRSRKRSRDSHAVQEVEACGNQTLDTRNEGACWLPVRPCIRLKVRRLPSGVVQALSNQDEVNLNDDRIACRNEHNQNQNDGSEDRLGHMNRTRHIEDDSRETRRDRTGHDQPRRRHRQRRKSRRHHDEDLIKRCRLENPNHQPSAASSTARPKLVVLSREALDHIETLDSATSNSSLLSIKAIASRLRQEQGVKDFRCRATKRDEEKFEGAGYLSSSSNDSGFSRRSHESCRSDAAVVKSHVERPIASIDLIPTGTNKIRVRINNPLSKSKKNLDLQKKLGQKTNLTLDQRREEYYAEHPEERLKSEQRIASSSKQVQKKMSHDADLLKRQEANAVTQMLIDLQRNRDRGVILSCSFESIKNMILNNLLHLKNEEAEENIRKHRKRLLREENENEDGCSQESVKRGRSGEFRETSDPDASSSIMATSPVEGEEMTVDINVEDSDDVVSRQEKYLINSNFDLGIPEERRLTHEQQLHRDSCRERQMALMRALDQRAPPEERLFQQDTSDPRDPRREEMIRKKWNKPVEDAYLFAPNAQLAIFPRF